MLKIFLKNLKLKKNLKVKKKFKKEYKCSNFIYLLK